MNYKKLSPEAHTPVYSTSGAAGMDVGALLTEDVVLQPKGSMVLDTGLAFEVPTGFAMLALSRSGHGFKLDISLANSVGLIDSDYRGEVKVKLINHGSESLTISNGDRIVQLMIVPVPAIQLVQVDELNETARGGDGFGSTGVAQQQLERDEDRRMLMMSGEDFDAFLEQLDGESFENNVQLQKLLSRERRWEE